MNTKRSMLLLLNFLFFEKVNIIYEKNKIYLKHHSCTIFKTLQNYQVLKVLMYLRIHMDV